MGVKSWTDVKGGKSSWRDGVEFAEMKSGKWKTFRMVKGVLPIAMHWYRTKGGKNFPTSCANFNPETERWEERGCPACEAKIRAGRGFLQNVIDRQLQQHGDPNPVRLWEIGTSMSIGIRKAAGLLNEKYYANEDQMYGPEHSKKGCDLDVQYDRKQPSTSRYTCQLGERNALTPEEKEYEYYDLESLYVPNTIEEIAEAVAKHCPEDGDGNDSAAPASKRKKVDLDDKKHVAITDLDDDEDEEEDESFSASSDDDDDDTENFDENFDDEEEEEEAPAPKRRTTKGGSNKPKPKPEEDEDGEPSCFGNFSAKSKKCKKCSSKFDCMDD